MKPYKILLYLISVITSLYAISYVFPEKGIEIYGGVKLRFPAFDGIFNIERIDYADISEVVKIDTSLLIASEIDEEIIAKKRILNDFRYDTLLTDEMRAKLHRLQYPVNNRMLLYPFFRQLLLLREEGNLIRILHYGDSQIEGDRITSLLRYNFQTRFGGEGPGMIALNDITPTSSVNREFSTNWRRYTMLGRVDTSLTGNIFGPMLSFARFLPHQSDSIIDQSKTTEAWLRLSRSGWAYPNTRAYSTLNLFYGNNKTAVSLQISDKEGNILFVDSLMPSTDISKKTWYFEQKPDFLFLRFNGAGSPDIYCLTLDPDKGIAVDNIPMRGSSGVDFTKTNMDVLGQFYNEMNVKLLIMEFGVNVAPHILTDYTFYENALYRNLMALKRLDPELCIIVMGISDMSRKREDGEGYETYPNIEKIRNAQKNAAFRASCAFWDTYEAMGGRNSMPSWVMAEPPLAAKDFTHFNAAGAKIIAKMFYNALIAEYEDYLRLNHLRNLYNDKIEEIKVDTPM